jgi:hypothetical protein
LTLLLAAPAAPEDRLASAVEAFEFGEHERAVRILSALLDPIALDDRASVLRARAYLGAGQVLLGREERARETFSLLLALEPNHRLDAAVFPPQVMEVFREVRRASGLDVLQPPSEETRAPPPDETSTPAPDAAHERTGGPPPLPRVPTALPPPPAPSPALALVPFGVGQFANGHPVRGAAFASAELGLFATALASFVAFEDLKARDGTFEARDVGQAETLQTAYLATFWTGVGVAALGIVEALVSHPGERAPLAGGPEKPAR